jgi:hypothetical protein
MDSCRTAARVLTALDDCGIRRGTGQYLAHINEAQERDGCGHTQTNGATKFMHGKVQSLEQQETAGFAGFGAPIAGNSGLSLGSNCVVISWFAEIMSQRNRNQRKIVW